MRLYRIFLFVSIHFLCFPFFIGAQNWKTELSPVISEIVEELAASGLTESSIELVYEDLIYYSENKININSANGDELAGLHFLNEVQIENILLFVKKQGGLFSIYELQYAEGIDLELAMKLEPFLFFGILPPRRHYSFVENLTRVDNFSFQQKARRIIEDQWGYSGDTSISPTQKYIGSPYYLSTKLVFGNSRKWRAGFGMEKDAGELFFTNGKTSDFFTGFIELRKLKWIDLVILGDYRVQMGQGLICGPGYGAVKQVDNPMVFYQRGTMIKAHSSTDEIRYLRGAAFSFSRNFFQGGVFASSRKLDVNLDTLMDADNEEVYLTSLLESGYHRNQDELSSRRKMYQQVIGGQISFRKGNISVGTNILVVNQDYSKFEASKEVYQLFSDFSGNQRNISFDFRYSIPHGFVFGEFALDKELDNAIYSGLMIYPVSAIGWSMVYRNYQPNYFAPFSSSFSEGSGTYNESGIFSGIEFTINQKFKLTGFYDQFQFPWLRYQVSSPSNGTDIGFQLNYSASRDFLVYFRYRTKVKGMNESNSQIGIESLCNTQKDSYRIHSELTITPGLAIDSRIEYLRYIDNDQAEQLGFLLFQGIKIKSDNLPLQLNFRYSVFDATNYDARIYVYESDLPGEFSIPSFYNKGTRFYSMIRYTVSENLSLWMRYSRTWHSNRNSIGTGLDEIQASYKSDIKFLIRYSF